MKPFLKTLLLLLITIVSNPAKSQRLVVGATGNIGLSKVSSNLPLGENYKVKFTLSGNFGLFLAKKVSQKSSFGIEALWMQIEGNEKSKNRELTVFNGQELIVIGVISEKTRIHSSYLAVPVYYRFEIGKFGIKGGVQPMIFLFASSNYEGNGEINGEPYHQESKTKDVKFDRIDFGPKIGIDYRLSGKFKIRADYYHGLLDITSDEFPWQRRNRQVNLGIE